VGGVVSVVEAGGGRGAWGGGWWRGYLVVGRLGR